MVGLDACEVVHAEQTAFLSWCSSWRLRLLELGYIDSMEIDSGLVGAFGIVVTVVTSWFTLRRASLDSKNRSRPYVTARIVEDVRTSKAFFLSRTLGSPRRGRRGAAPDLSGAVAHVVGQARAAIAGLAYATARRQPRLLIGELIQLRVQTKCGRSASQLPIAYTT